MPVLMYTRAPTVVLTLFKIMTIWWWCENDQGLAYRFNFKYL